MTVLQIGLRVKELLTKWGFSESFTSGMRDITDFIIAFILIVLTYYVVKFIVLGVVHRITKRSSTTWDDALYDNRVFHKAVLLVPGFLLNFLSPFTLNEFPDALNWVIRLTQIYMIFVTLFTINAFLNAVYDIYQGYEVSKSKPVKGYLQVFKIIMFIVGIIVVISMLLDKSPVFLLGGLGAFSAVLLLIFRDPILGLVAGIQISANDMVRPGDWIVMDKSGADGEVTDISLTTVKVQNWDKTITTIPTYSLVSESFINWRGMEESGGRRIKRSVNIDVNSVKFCSSQMIEKFRKIDLLRNYINFKEKELSDFNRQSGIDDSIIVNGRRQTNLGVFRAYLSAYLRNNPDIRTDMTFLVRQLQPRESGIPIEIYVFSKVQEWAKYEDIQSDIFDHILASIPEFELKVFQNPSGADFRAIRKEDSLK
ncbi:MAG: mechanosensitive ion channel [Lentimicrobiaceae bacterium]|nr:mechanosensitive ion channel [Lentimicrobiaceae bacterium]MCB9022960.1 mechanosensitive ion channel [Lentimicrobiaceae bacterium]MCO5266129.1 mechanosensitive ion channel [Lentimicrobium sp.]HPG34055.1 mechanosensitive ion channel [Lentimicrobium sp.]